ncbi:SgcJ/EcaC family oxidoreductase [Sphingopyxis sp.]|uniref:SgcJ/EcaC family oxidoreductase n=1 Tax=Sphingopyxis sp. TaxID=1908224 RepID=UPI0026276581|nr:SgcJ/EcaC family oxidoreductase [Sphingopyxis sp.]MCW0197535.1 SgcJ/EcaC family oxidoreductase [Sphingopyxis sp.]
MAQDKGPTDIAARFADAWNRHDMAAFASLFHADASFVNRFGTYWRGVERIVAGHVPIHETIYSDSTLINAVADVDAIAIRRSSTRSPTSMRSPPMP